VSNCRGPLAAVWATEGATNVVAPHVASVESNAAAAATTPYDVVDPVLMTNIEESSLDRLVG
jgi:hypothetical protein